MTSRSSPPAWTRCPRRSTSFRPGQPTKKLNLRPSPPPKRAGRVNANSEGTTMDDKKLQDELKDSAHKIWLAGLGALAAAEQEGTKVFNRLVDRGREVESRGKVDFKEQVDQAKVKVDQAKAKV